MNRRIRQTRFYDRCAEFCFSAVIGYLFCFVGGSLSFVSIVLAILCLMSAALCLFVWCVLIIKTVRRDLSFTLFSLITLMVSICFISDYFIGLDFIQYSRGVPGSSFWYPLLEDFALYAVLMLIAHVFSPSIEKVHSEA